MLLYTKIVKKILSGKRTVHDDTKSIMHNVLSKPRQNSLYYKADNAIRKLCVGQAPKTLE